MWVLIVLMTYIIYFIGKWINHFRKKEYET